MKQYFILLMFLVSAVTFSQNTDTDNSTLEKIFTRVADTVIGQDGRWQLLVQERILICITDEDNNRMRIMSPVTDVANLDETELLNALTANFHTALDVKYAISDDVLWSAFIHPLRELQASQIEDAVLQVYNAAETFGTLYSSTNLSFPRSTRKSIEKKKIQELQKG